MTSALDGPAPTGLILSASAVQPVGGLFRPAAPAIIVRRLGGPPKPPDTSAMQVDIHRQPLRVALDWQLDAVRLWREHPTFCPSFATRMAEAGLSRRQVVLFTKAAGDPLRFAYIGEPTRRFFGDAWADAQLGRPHMDDGYSAFSLAIDAEYREAIAGGEPVHNRLVVHGLPGQPFIYTHTLLGWSLPSGRSVVVVLVDY